MNTELYELSESFNSELAYCNVEQIRVGHTVSLLVDFKQSIEKYGLSDPIVDMIGEQLDDLLGVSISESSIEQATETLGGLIKGAGKKIVEIIKKIVKAAIDFFKKIFGIGARQQRAAETRQKAQEKIDKDIANLEKTRKDAISNMYKEIADKQAEYKKYTEVLYDALKALPLRGKMNAEEIFTILVSADQSGEYNLSLVMNNVVPKSPGMTRVFMSAFESAWSDDSLTTSLDDYLDMYKEAAGTGRTSINTMHLEHFMKSNHAKLSSINCTWQYMSKRVNKNVDSWFEEKKSDVTIADLGYSGYTEFIELHKKMISLQKNISITFKKASELFSSFERALKVADDQQFGTPSQPTEQTHSNIESMNVLTSNTLYMCTQAQSVLNVYFKYADEISNQGSMFVNILSKLK